MTAAQPALFADPNPPRARPGDRRPLRDEPGEIHTPLAPAPAGGDPRAKRTVSIHWTLYAPGIPIDAKLDAACRWATLFGATATAAVRHLLERLALKPWDLRVRDTPAGELIAYLADPDQPLAIVTEGLTAAEARIALDQLRRDWSRP